MRIIHIISHFDNGGAERVAINIAKSASSGYEYHIVEVASTSGEFRDSLIRECKESNISIHKSHISVHKIAIIAFPFRFISLMLKIKPDVIHSHTEIPDISLLLWYYLFGRFFPNVKYVRTIHNTVLWQKWKGVGSIAERFFKKSHANVAISKSVMESYSQSYCERPPIINNGIDIVPQRHFYGIVPNKTNILFAGRLEYQKGVEELIQVIKVLRNDDRFVFHIVGDGEMKDQVKKLSNLPFIKIYDRIYGLASYLSSFDYLFMPSNFEGLALLSIEASMAKTPVIINDCLGLKDTLPIDWPLKSNNNNINDYLTILNGIENYDRNILGQTAYKYAHEKFEIKNMQNKYEALYNNRLNEPRP